MKARNPRKTGKNTPSRNQTPRITLDRKFAGAQAVFIAGDFNDWHPGSVDMIDMGDGRWVKELVLAPGRYEYMFVVDGQWIPDPQAAESAPNPFGGVNSVLNVSAP